MENKLLPEIIAKITSLRLCVEELKRDRDYYKGKYLDMVERVIEERRVRGEIPEL